MSYTYQTAFVRPKGINQRWVEKDVSGISIGELLNEYHQLFLVLINPYITGSVSFDLTQHRNLVQSLSWTVDQWLAILGNNTLPTTNGLPEIQYKKARYKDALQAGYAMRRVHPTAHPDVYFPEADQRDIMLSKEGINYEFLQKHALVSVNGFFHKTTFSSHGVRIVDGAKSALLYNDTNVGILSTVNLGSVEYVSITEDMIYKLDDSHKLSSKAFINLGVDTEDKTVLLCLGGYLHILDGSYRNFGNNQISIDMTKIHLLHRYIESRECIDLSSIQQYFTIDGDAVPVDTVFSDEAIKAYLTLPQSFFVVIDTPTLITTRKDLEVTGLPGVLIAHQRPEDLMFIYSGKSPSYRTQQEWGQWVVSFNTEFERSYRFDTTDWLNEPLINDGEDIAHLGQLARGYLLELGTEIVTV